MTTRLLAITAFTAVIFTACTDRTRDDTRIREGETAAGVATDTLTILSHRSYESDRKLYERFRRITKIAVRIVRASPEELLTKLRSGRLKGADILFTHGVANFETAKTYKLLQPINTAQLDRQITADRRDDDRCWYAVSERIRAIAYAKGRVNPEKLTDYDALLHDDFKNRVLIASVSNTTAQSFRAWRVLMKDGGSALTDLERLIANRAAGPVGNDRSAVLAIANGIGDVAYVNHNIPKMMLTSSLKNDSVAASKVGLVFPEVPGGLFFDITAVAVTQTTDAKEAAVRFAEFITSEQGQRLFCKTTHEAPANRGVEIEGAPEFTTADIDLNDLGHRRDLGVAVMREAAANRLRSSQSPTPAE